MPEHQTVTFSLNGMIFEYDEAKNKANIKSMVFRSEPQPASSSTMTALSFLTMRTVSMKIAMM